MKDIDFDELDKAVNSLMSSVDQPQGAAPENSPQSNESAPTPAPQSTSPAMSPTPQVTPAPAPVAQPTTAAAASQAIPARPPAPAVRRTGRFMDMVNTSSPKVSSTPAAASREGLSITPRRGQIDSAPAAPAPSPAPVSTPAPANMPDPLDITVPSAETEAAPVESTEPTVASPIETSTSLDSPFLTDAKVEKRPLNPGAPLDTPAVPQAEQVSEPADIPSGEVSDEAESEQPAKDKDEPVVNPQVPELASDLVAIESTEKIEATQATETAAATSQVEEPSVPLGASSIAQQYKTAPSTGDQSHAAIYDASQYPQPVAHPAKHRSSWWWVLWVVLLLGVGAGGAVLMYNLGIIP